MKIAVTAADQVVLAALEQERADASKGGAARLRERLDLAGGNSSGQCAEGGIVLFDVVAERRDPWLGGDGGCRGVGSRHGAAERIREGGVDPARFRQTIERRILIEAAHLDRPFDRRPVAVERGPPSGARVIGTTRR